MTGQITIPSDPPSANARPAPLLLPACAMMIGIIAADYRGVVPGMVAALGVVILEWALPRLRLAPRVEWRSAWPSLVVGFLALAIGYLRHQTATQLPPHHIAHALSNEPRIVRVEGIVVSPQVTLPAEKRNPFLPVAPAAKTRFILEVRHSRTAEGAMPLCGLLRVSVNSDALALKLGDRVEAIGALHALRGPRNPGERDWARWQRLQGIHAGLHVEDDALLLVHDAPETTWRHAIQRLRATARGFLFESYDTPSDDAGARMLDALVLGQRSAVDRKLNDAFLRTGAIHFLSVSGFHVGALMLAVWLILRFGLRIGPRKTAIVAMIILVLYALIAEPSSPIFRAAVMGLLYCAGVLAGRAFAGLNWLSLSAIVILLFNPLELFQAGFQLSFLQVFALLWVVPPIYLFITGASRQRDRDVHTYRAFFRRLFLRLFVGLVVTCICCWIVALPLTLYYFGMFTPWAAIQSVLISPLVTLVTVLGLLKVVLSPFIPDALLAIPLEGLTDGLLWIVTWMASWPLTLVNVPYPPLWLTIASEFAVFALLWPRRRSAAEQEAPDGFAVGGAEVDREAAIRRRRSWGRRGLVLVAVATTWGVWLWQRGRLEGEFRIHVLAVGDGSAALVQSADGKAALIDVGTRNNSDAGQTVIDAARDLAIDRLTFASISHANLDHFSGLPVIAANLPPDVLFAHPRFIETLRRTTHGYQFLHQLPASLPPWSGLHRGEHVSLGGATIEVLWPPADVPDALSENDRSLVLRMQAHGLRVLFPGDIERDAMRALLDLHEQRAIDLRSDVLIAPHHGAVIARTTAEFYRIVDPEIVVASTAQNRDELCALIVEVLGRDCRLLVTDEDGAVTIRLTPDSRIEVESPFAADPLPSLPPYNVRR